MQDIAAVALEHKQPVVLEMADGVARKLQDQLGASNVEASSQLADEQWILDRLLEMNSHDAVDETSRVAHVRRIGVTASEISRLAKSGGMDGVERLAEEVVQLVWFVRGRGLGEAKTTF